MPLIIYCVACQHAVCGLCVTEHSAKSHQLMHPSDYAKSVLKAQIGELLAALNSEGVRFTAPKKEELMAWTAALDQYIGTVSKELDKLKEVAKGLREWCGDVKREGPHEATAMRLRTLIQEIEMLSKTANIERIKEIEGEYKQIAERKPEKPLLIESRPGMILDSLKLLEIPLALQAAATQIGQYLRHFKPSPFLYTTAKFVSDSFDPSFPCLWKLSNNALTTRKENETTTVSICAVNIPITSGHYEIVFKLEQYPRADSCDSFGIGPRSSLGVSAFNGSSMYGLFNDIIFANGSHWDIPHQYKAGDIVMLVYSSSKRTLSYYVNGTQIGNSIKGILQETYYAGVSMRNVGCVISLISFTKS